MRLRQWLYPLIALLILVALFVGYVTWIGVPKASYAVQPHTDSGLVGWPFDPSIASWQISYGYDAPYPSDHNCKQGGICHQRYGFDFVATNHPAKGLIVYSPATGHVYPFHNAAAYGEGDCFVVAVGTGTNMYVMICHVVLDNLNISYANKGDRVGVVFDADNVGNTHIHMNLFSSTNASTLMPRNAVPFADPWMIQGCNYPLAPGETPDNLNYVYPPKGYHSGEAVPCGNQGATPNLTVHWGDSSFTSNGINLSRPVLVEVRNTFNNTDLFKQKVTTDANGTATLPLTGIIPGYYTVMLKPDGFLRQSTTVTLQPGANTVSFPMTVSGTACYNGQPTGPQLWIGDVNSDNVINTADYNIILAYFGRSIPPQYVDLDGDSSHTYSGVDYNAWLRSICYFGGGRGFVVGAGGAIDTLSSSSLHTMLAPSHVPPVIKTVPGAPHTPILQQTPVATPRPEHAPPPWVPPATQVVTQTTKQTLHTMSGSGTLSMSPSTGNYRVGQSFTVTIQGNSGGLALDGVDIVLHYDPLVLSVNSITAGSIFPNTPVQANDPSIGEIHISSHSNGQPIVVSGSLASIQFTVIGSGQTNVTFDYNSGSNARSDMSQNGNPGQVLGSVSNATFTVGILRVPQDYSTITSALAAAYPAETVRVAAGTYHEQFYVPSGVILQGQDRDTTIIDGDAVANRAVIYMGNGSTISGFTVQDSGTDFYDAGVWADQGPVTINNMRLIHNSMGIVRYCFTTPCPGNSTISNNVVIHNTYTGILVHAVEALVQNNTVIDNQLQGITYEADGSQGTCVGNIIAYNLRGLAATSATTLVNNQLWQNNPDYDPSTTPGPSDVVADPLFLNASTSDYRLHAVSPAVQAGIAIGAYPFIATGITPNNLSVTQNVSGVTVSWQPNGQASGYTVSYAQGSSAYFSQVIDVGNSSSFTFPSSQFSGPVTFGISSYDGQHNESFASYYQATIATDAVNPTNGSHNQTISVSGAGFGSNEIVRIYLDSAANSPVTVASADSTGAFAGSFNVPEATSGTHTVVAVGQTSGVATGTPFQVNAAAALLHTSGTQGSQNSITGYGFAGNETVKVYWMTQGGQLLGTSTTNSLGTSTITFTIPSSPAGNYNVYIVGQSSGTVVFSTFTLTSSKPSLTLSPTSGARGSSVLVTGTGYSPNETVTIKWNCTSSKCSSKIILGTVTTDSNGNFSLRVTIPKNTPLGKHTVGAIGGTSRKFASAVYKTTS